jgi:hypothetical protein
VDKVVTIFAIVVIAGGAIWFVATCIEEKDRWRDDR